MKVILGLCTNEVLFNATLSHSCFRRLWSGGKKDFLFIYLILSFIYLTPFIYFNAFLLLSSFSITPVVTVIYFFSSFFFLPVKGKNYSPHYFQACLSHSHSRKEMLCTEELSCSIFIYLYVVKIHQWFSHSFYLPESSAWILDTVCSYVECPDCQNVLLQVTC